MFSQPNVSTIIPDSFQTLESPIFPQGAPVLWKSSPAVGLHCSLKMTDDPSSIINHVTEDFFLTISHITIRFFSFICEQITEIAEVTPYLPLLLPQPVLIQRWALLNGPFSVGLFLDLPHQFSFFPRTPFSQQLFERSYLVAELAQCGSPLLTTCLLFIDNRKRWIINSSSVV